MEFFQKFVGKATRVDSYWSLGQWILWAIFGVTGFSGAALTAWAFSTWEWFWQSYQWAGVAAAALIAWLLISIALYLTALTAQIFGRIRQGKNKSCPDPNNKFNLWPDNYQPIVVSGKKFRNEEVIIDGNYYIGCDFSNVTLVYNGTTPPNLHSNTFGGVWMKSENPAVFGTLALALALGWIEEWVQLDAPGHQIGRPTRGGTVPKPPESE